MKLHEIDILIICAYLIAMIVIGLILKKRAAQNMDSYFLGGKSLPFYMLGLSNASGMFDITGTMLMVYWAFAYGFKSLWIPWLWPVFNQIFLMVYLSVWLRRSNVLTVAEWIKTRFGKGKGSTLSHTIVIIFALLSVLGFLSYGFIGIGKFMEIFIPSCIWYFLYRNRYFLCNARRNVEYCMDRRCAVPDYDSGRYRNCCYRNANGSAGHDSFFRSGRLGLSFLRMDAGYRLEQSDEPLDGTDGE